MSSVDPILNSLMAPGAPFEVVEEAINGRALRIFKHAPTNLADVINAARRFGDTEFIIAGERRLTFADYFAAVDHLSGWLVNEGGVRPGQSVGICMKNCPEWMTAFAAIIQIGAVAVLINSRGTGEAMTRMATDANCVFVLADRKCFTKMLEAGLELRVLLNEDFNRVVQHAPVTASRAPEDTAAMFFTSGTTGRAKAAAISHRALVTGTMNTQMAMAAVFQKMAAAYNITTDQLRARMPQGCSLLVFPLFHTSGCSAVFLTAITNGGKLVLMDRWSADAALKLTQDEKITSIGGVPTMMWDILQCENLDSYDLSSLMSLSCGGQALPLNLLDAIHARFPQAYIGAGYGMTETSGAVSQANGEAFLANPTASGQVLPMVDVQITRDDGTPCETGEVGEIWTKGAIMMQGYYGRPEDTAKSMSGDWFKTGDIGKLDENGYIYIVDRKTDMVISGGENIYCAEVEQVLGRHPAVLQVTSFGVPDDRLGERLIAAVRLKDADVDMTAFAVENLADYKRPTEFIYRETPFMLNAMGKIEKQIVREDYLRGQERGG